MAAYSSAAGLPGRQGKLSSQHSRTAGESAGGAYTISASVTEISGGM
jgi:hypothetical protein